MLSRLRAGVFVDAENISRTGGRSMSFAVLRDFVCRDGYDLARGNVYLAHDEERARRDALYRDRANRYQFAWRAAGFKVIEKPVKWFVNDDGVRVSKANADVELATDLVLSSGRLDRLVLVTGDGDFCRVVAAVQTMGARVELVGFENVSYDLRCECDLFVSGYLIPGLLPTGAKGPVWGEIGSRVRGTCYHFNFEKRYGFFRYLVDLDNLSVTDVDRPGCPWREVFFRTSDCPLSLDLAELPSRDHIFEFSLAPGRENGKLEARDIQLIYSYGSHGANGRRST